MIGSLAALVAPMPESDFVRCYLDGTLTVIGSTDRTRLEELLPWTTLNGLLESDRIVPPRARVARDGLIVPPDLWFRPLRRPRTDADGLDGLLRQGATLVIDTIDTLVPAIHRLCGAMSRTLRSSVRANAYVGFRRGSSVPVHFDTRDVVVAQIHGTKRWWFYDRRELFPVHRGPGLQDIGKIAPPGSAVREERLDPGHIALVPRGEWHKTEVVGDYSVHLAINVEAARGLDAIYRLTELAHDDPWFRRDLPQLAGPDALARHEAALKTRLSDLIASLTLEDIIATQIREEMPAPISGDDPSSGGAPPRFHLPFLSDSQGF